ncbi:galactokinase [Roseobacter sp.]|uniref:GHMP family kinase ATP-binding protein n=1 Tax=Roseobacter sp. TaxID=1907202 RepID=UPI00296640C4|nr:galactokinase [Roseobacter sp.]MDW3181178.1 galactokinase [Roseobacter sp.]
MIIAKAPVRVSLFGGGTDYKEYYEQYPGAVLGTSIDKYIYISVLPMAAYAENRYRITYRTVEAVDRIEDIQHNVIRETLKHYGYDAPLNIATLSDLPGRSGLGSSSSFTVGFLRLIEHLRGRDITKLDLAMTASFVEHDLLKENVGIQDQLHAAFGGLNLYSFHGEDLSISPVRMVTENRDALNDALCLIFTGETRHASNVVSSQVENTKARKIDKELSHLVKLAHEGKQLMETRSSEGMLKELGRLLKDAWETKRSLSASVSTPRIDEIYETGMRLGAYGGKLCGAGGGGFFMFLAPPHVQKTLAESFGAQNFVKISMENRGAEVIHS